MFNSNYEVHSRSSDLVEQLLGMFVMFSSSFCQLLSSLNICFRLSLFLNCLLVVNQSCFPGLYVIFALVTGILSNVRSSYGRFWILRQNIAVILLICYCQLDYIYPAIQMSSRA